MKTGLRLILFSLIILSATATAQDYVIIGWNDVGMHRANRDFSKLSIMPPYNNVFSQVIQVGDSLNMPVLVTTGMRVAYSVPGNSYSVGKTNFWDYEDALYGVSLADNTGLTGAGLAGDLGITDNYFHIEGIPLTPYQDADLIHEDPYQLGLFQLYNSSEELVASTQVVLPVSNEINCVAPGCHVSELAILIGHATLAGFDPGDAPILCADCHGSALLGLPGEPGTMSLSEAIHTNHGTLTNDCYRCHPGPVAQHLRGVMQHKNDMVCQDCHGSVTEVGTSIAAGREPWVDLPSCGDPTCHAAEYATEPGKLYHESKGHSGLFCSACHGAPHAILPSRVARDNAQYIALQGYSGTLDKCEVCHGVAPTGAGPHGLFSQGCCNGYRGNINNDLAESIDIADLIDLVSYMFQEGPDLPCFSEADVNGSGDLLPDIADLIYLVSYMFQEGPAPPSCFSLASK